MGIEEVRRIEVDEAGEEAAIGVVGSGLEGKVQGAELVGERLRGDCKTGDDAERATASALERPKEVSITRFIDHADNAVGGDNLGFEEASRGHAIGLGEAAEPAAQQQP